MLQEQKFLLLVQCRVKIEQRNILVLNEMAGHRLSETRVEPIIQWILFLLLLWNDLFRSQFTDHLLVISFGEDLCKRVLLVTVEVDKFLSEISLLNLAQIDHFLRVLVLHHLDSVQGTVGLQPMVKLAAEEESRGNIFSLRRSQLEACAFLVNAEFRSFISISSDYHGNRDKLVILRQMIVYYSLVVH